MTVLVGVKCTEGIVLGADSIATSAAGHTPIMQMQYPSKIEVVAGRVLIATTGSVGLAQRFQTIVKEAHDKMNFQKPCLTCSAGISGTTCADFSKSGTPRYRDSGFGLGALLAAPFGDEVELVEFALGDFQPEVKKEPLHFVSMGSGQTLADPFLAFVNKVLWNKKSPSVADGLLGLYWVLNHTCDLAPGGVGKPIRLAVLKREKGKWAAKTFEEQDMQQMAQHVTAIEERIGSYTKDIIAQATGTPPPQPPQT